MTRAPWLLALDDTDSPEGGCTTHVALSILRTLGGEVVAGPPRLVRLDPLAEHKTRGNAAVVLPLDPDRVGSPDDVLDAAFDVVRRHARLSPHKGAGLLLTTEPPQRAWYTRAVRGPVTLAEVQTALQDAGTPHRTLGTGRGLIGAWCAAAWSPGGPPDGATWERIAYRERFRWGTPREVEAATLEAVEAAYAEVFDCVDARSGRPVMVPRTPCPVLYGLRATRPDRLVEACAGIVSEPVADVLTFVTNHASDDHLPDAVLEPLTAMQAPVAHRGGHVTVETQTPDGGVRTVVAFEPTGRLRHALLAVAPGDRLLALGSVRADQVNLEKLLHLPAARRRRTTCPACRRALSSTGRGGPLKCARCGHRQVATYQPGQPRWSEADTRARRHLSRPLALGLAPRIAEAAARLTRPTSASAPTRTPTPTPTRTWTRRSRVR